MTSSDPAPALILGTGVTALGVLRTLSRAGIPTFTRSTPPGIERRSRWYRAGPEPLGGSRPEPQSSSRAGTSGVATPLAEYLEAIPLERAVLMPCSDELVLAAASLSSELTSRFVSCIPPRSALEVLVDKGRFRDLLVANEVAHPATHLGNDTSQLETLLETAGEPLFIKPRFSHELQAELGVKGLRPENVKDFRAAMEALESRHIEFLIQEYVPG
ncbi:MAG: hypothetical protein PVJ76_19445, partial [Gemmatimonadota bacterium]